jgi:hypothetical protein
MSPQWIAEQSGFSVPKDISIIGVNCELRSDPKSRCRAKSSRRFWAFYKVKGPEEGFEKCEQMLEFGGLGHSAAIHCKEQAMADAFGDKVKALRVIWNSPSTFGGIGNVYNSFLPSLTLGCGSYGHNSVGGNVRRSICSISRKSAKGETPCNGSKFRRRSISNAIRSNTSVRAKRSAKSSSSPTTHGRAWLPQQDHR